MSRLGKKPLQIPESVKVEITGNGIVVSGVKGSLAYSIPEGLKVELGSEGREVTISLLKDDKALRSMHGLFVRTIQNATVGVTSGWSKTLELVGTGYRGKIEGRDLVLALGYSHPIKFVPPENISFSVEENKITVNGISKEVVGQIAANIKRSRPPEPYQGKGVRYQGEYIRRKAGKSAKVGGGE